MDYEKQAEQFAEKHNVKMAVKFLKFDYHFINDTDKRNIYRITLKRNGKQYSFNFCQSVNDTENNIQPTIYGVLSCLTKYDPGTYDDYLSEYGYNFNINNRKQYNSIVNEYNNVMRLFSDIIDELSDIQ